MCQLVCSSHTPQITQITLLAACRGLVVGRLVVGLGIGASAIVVPAYLAEISPAARRGAVVQMYEVMLCVGMLVSVLMDWLLEVRGCRHYVMCT
jgi:MFS family permease